MATKAPKKVAGEPKAKTAKKKTIKRKKVTLQFEGQPNAKVYVVGSFNGWSINDDKKVKVMKEDQKQRGNYSINMYLPLGDHEYKFYSNGKWYLNANSDKKQNPFGSFNNVVSVNP